VYRTRIGLESLDGRHCSGPDHQSVETVRSLGGKVIIPSFAIGRTQELLYRFHELFGQKKIAPIATYLDSPMAIKVADVFKAHAELNDAEMRSLVEERNSPFRCRISSIPKARINRRR